MNRHDAKSAKLLKKSPRVLGAIKRFLAFSVAWRLENEPVPTPKQGGKLYGTNSN